MEPDIIERYDRQIRLWGQHGQSKCSNSKICLINANSLGVEVLRGLCLAGIGSFTILDSHKLTPEDVGCNFIQQDCVGKSRAESAKSVLLDYNEEVSGEVFPIETYLPQVTHNNKDPQEDLSHDLSFWKQFNCVIASGFLSIDQITRLSRICWTINIPLIFCKSIGFFGSLRCQINEHLIIETHPDNVLPNFNLDKPFEDLKRYFDSINLDDETQIDEQNSYPYVVILYKYLRLWQAQNGYPHDRLPNSYSEKSQLRTLILEGLKRVTKKRKESRADDPQVLPFENYLEAGKSVNSCLTVSSKLPSSVEAIFSHPKVLSSTSQNVSMFWLIIRAIKQFVLQKNDGQLPVTGQIPDMTSSSEEYIRLQSIYLKKARDDIDDVFGIVQSFNNSTSCSPGSSLFEETKLICKNISDLRIMSSCPIYEEYDSSTCTTKEEDEDDEFITIGLCLRALDVFYTTYGRVPGRQDDQVETDVSKLKDCVKQIIGKASNRLKTLDQCLYELCRYGGAELHATSAFIGGCVAQEIIKLVTNQYVPVNETLVYNAMAAETKSFVFAEILDCSKM